MNKRNILSKTISFLLLFSLSATLFSGSVSAKEIGGTLSDGEIKWQYDDVTDTLTLTGDGDSVLTEIVLIRYGIRSVQLRCRASHRSTTN